MSARRLECSDLLIQRTIPNGREARDLSAALIADGLTVQVRSEGAWRTVVRGVSLTLQRGQVDALVGETGCGKTLTALALIGLLPPAARLSGGRIIVNGQKIDVNREAGWRGVRGSQISMVAQDPLAALNPVRTVEFQLCEPLRANLELSGREATLQASALLDQVGIARSASVLKMYPHELSGGMRQRVLIAMALASNPAVLLADEPTTAIDVTIQAQILRLLRELAVQRGLAVLLVTHDLAVASQIADRVQVMYAGSMAETGKTTDVLGRATHPYTRGLVSCVPRVDRRVSPMPTLTGTASGAWAIENGCRFAPRCEFAQNRCRLDEPRLEMVGEEHAASCWVFAPPGARLSA
jgi:oligopeptide/dipeptide ABC transporter ATP-binding protein